MAEAEILFSEEERKHAFMGDIAFERETYEREIQELRKQLNEKERYVKAEFATKDREHAKELEAVKREHQGSFNKIEQLEKEVTRLRTASAASKADVKKIDALVAYFDKLDTRLANSNDQDPERLAVELENTRMILLMVCRLFSGGNVGQETPTEGNNLIAAIREYMNAKLDFILSTQDSLATSMYKTTVRELVYAHIRDIFQPHKINTGIWLKDVDLSLHPFKGIVPERKKVQDDQEKEEV